MLILLSLFAAFIVSVAIMGLLAGFYRGERVP